MDIPKPMRIPLETWDTMSVLERAPFVEELYFLRRLLVETDDFNLWRHRISEKARRLTISDPESSHCRVTTVPKPAGLRTLTIGSGYLGTSVLPVQGQILDAWSCSKHSTFKGRVRENIQKFVKQFGKMKRKIIKLKMGLDYQDVEDLTDWHFLSGDYSEATDYILPDLTLSAYEALVPCGLSDPEIGRHALKMAHLWYTPSWVNHTPCDDWAEKEAECEKVLSGTYPSWYNPVKPGNLRKKHPFLKQFFEEPHCSVQKRGQMMGNWLSFGLLCGVNGGAFRCAVRRWYQARPTEARAEIALLMWENFLVNGDDLLSYTPRSFYPFWLQAVKDAGFKVSMGKNYFVRDFAVINTRMFVMIPVGEKRVDRIYERGYVNLKMIHGDLYQANLSTPDQLGPSFSEMVQKCPLNLPFLPTVMSDRLHLWKDAPKGFTPNWFLPLHLGGYGSDPGLIRGKGLGVSDMQRKVAAYMVLHPRESCLYIPEVIQMETSLVFLRDKREVPRKKDWAPFLGSLLLCPLRKRKHSWAETLSPLQPQNKGVLDSLASVEHLEKNTFNSLTQLNKWANRSMAIENAKAIDHPKPVTLRACRYRLIRKTWIKPISDEGLCRYWKPDFRSSALPDCPPVSLLPYRGSYPQIISRSFRDQSFRPGLSHSLLSNRWVKVNCPGWLGHFQEDGSGELPQW
jgi:hypothetical protein